MKDIFIISIVQGITEFLPVSSTGHILLLNKFFHIPSFGRPTEIVLHLGTLFVVFAYFWRDMMNMIEGVFNVLRGKLLPGLWLFLFLCLATIPAVICGLMITKYAGSFGRSMTIIGWASIVSGALLYLVDQNMPTTKTLESMTFKDAILIGILQVIAFIPGASRLGTTIIAARLLGYKRTESARFSLLLSIPTILGAVTLMLTSMMKQNAFLFSSTLFLAMALAFAVGICILFLFMAWLKKGTFTPFAVYRIIFGIFVLCYF